MPDKWTEKKAIFEAMPHVHPAPQAQHVPNGDAPNPPGWETQIPYYYPGDNGQSKPPAIPNFPYVGNGPASDDGQWYPQAHVGGAIIQQTSYRYTPTPRPKSISEDDVKRVIAAAFVNKLYPKTGAGTTGGGGTTKRI